MLFKFVFAYKKKNLTISEKKKEKSREKGYDFVKKIFYVRYKIMKRSTAQKKTCQRDDTSHIF